ncbi:hypothetical protein VTK26DRAFT_5530 [Humicola hyalothermophila]
MSFAWLRNGLTRSWTSREIFPRVTKLFRVPVPLVTAHSTAATICLVAVPFKRDPETATAVIDVRLLESFQFGSWVRSARICDSRSQRNPK